MGLWIGAAVLAVTAVLFIGLFDEVPGIVTTGLSLAASGLVVAGIIVWGRADPAYDRRTFDHEPD
ncbi:hypothetical protein L3i23_02070 [Herbiconiux sp. L3-i23]|nr:hypothetical protein L3i23_02070 [Herbiconiux sp. L3-i23]